MKRMSTQASGQHEIPADTFEARLAMARFHAGNISAKEAAFRVGVSGQAWRNWEAGTSPGARKPAMMRFIAEQLGVDEHWLHYGTRETPRPDQPDEGSGDVVRREGIEPPTRWFRGGENRRDVRHELGEAA